jgi:hypothetical protein
VKGDESIQSVSTSRYRRRDPESTVLSQIVREHLATFFARIDTDPDRRGLAPHVRREFGRFLSCSIISAGSCRVDCPACREPRDTAARPSVVNNDNADDSVGLLFRFSASVGAGVDLSAW